MSEEARAELEEDDYALKVTNLYKDFKLPTERAWGLKQMIFNTLKGVKGFKTQHVLRGISFTVEKGEFLGIVGRNGSGKSTLLKVLAGIYVPEKGDVLVNGSLIPFIELGVGFNPELTGRENVYLNGALLGFSNAEMDKMYDDIVDFAELREFMNQKLKNYSSGMQVRLAFSIAIRARGDILILDEVLAVGDAAFQEKCNEYFKSLHGQQTVILVTHSMENVERFCDRAILIENGKILQSGDPKRVAKAYLDLFK
ncbi:ABC transporter ATP-binding protein [Candidatus Saccharibacteria bacterium]|nr:ABC transporter ATP-binding protein [Candidatus Saccharibacteria bacterium]MBQ3467955.1 ABC transporter ATP-binding protein [Candidatus Saccharibacteria bacterium]